MGERAERPPLPFGPEQVALLQAELAEQRGKAFQALVRAERAEAENSRLRSQLEDRDAEIVKLRKLDQHLTQAAVDREQRLREAEEAIAQRRELWDIALDHRHKADPTSTGTAHAEARVEAYDEALAALRSGRD